MVMMVVLVMWCSASPGMKSIQKLLSGSKTKQPARKEIKTFQEKAERMASVLGFHFSGYIPSERMRVLQGAVLEEEHKQQVGLRTFDLLVLLLGCCIYANSHKGSLAENVLRISKLRKYTTKLQCTFSKF